METLNQNFKIYSNPSELDLDQIIDLNHNYLTFCYDKEYIKKFHGLLLYAKRKNEVLGYILTKYRFKGDYNNNKEDYNHIYSIAVKEEYRNKGIGKMLLKETLDKVKFERTILDVHTRNKNAIRFYEKFGFFISGSRFRDKKIFIVMEKYSH